MADPAHGLFVALTMVVERGAASHALADRLRSGSEDIDAAVAGPLAELRATLQLLLRRAQAAGRVRPELGDGELDALLAAAHALQSHPSGGHHLVRLLWEGLVVAGPPAGAPGARPDEGADSGDG